MYRDFSLASKQNLLALVDQVEHEKWCNATDWIGDRWYDFEEWIGALNINHYLDNVNEYHKKVIDKNNASREAIERIFQDVAEVNASYYGTFSAVKSDVIKWIQYIQQMSEIIDPSHGLFTAANVNTRLQAIYDSISDIGKISLNWRDIEDYIYNPDNRGLYGGDQGSAKDLSWSEKIELYNIFRKNNPDITLTNEQINIYFNRMNSEGCGYIALVNTIFAYYINKPDAFRKTFGYDMYDSNGNLVYNKLFTDLYSKMDNRMKDGSFDEYYDYNDDVKSNTYDGNRDTYNYWNDEHGTGTTQYAREYYLEEFMREKGVDVDVKTDVVITPENCEQYLASGKQIIIAYRYGNLYNMDGSVAQYIDGGHAMTITGVTSEGYYIVSSWGGQYFIKPDEVIQLPDKDPTSMTFSTVRF